MVSVLILSYTGAMAVHCPARMPMQWDLQKRPTRHAPKGLLFGCFAAMLLVGVGLTIVRPAMAVGVARVLSSGLFLNACLSSTNEGTPPMMSVSTAMGITLALGLAAAGLTVAQAVRTWRSPGVAGPPRERPRAS